MSAERVYSLTGTVSEPAATSATQAVSPRAARFPDQAVGTEDIQSREATAGPSPSTVSTRDELLQLWKGIILDQQGKTVAAKIIDETDPERAPEIIEFDFDEFTSDDRPLVQTGAVFYLSIRYEQSVGRPRQRVTRLRMRRLAGFSTQQRRRALETRREAPWD